MIAKGLIRLSSSDTLQIPAIVQARMSSSRLPGKVLLPLCGKPVLDHVVNRVSAAQGVSIVWVATSDHQSDDPIEDWCFENNVSCYRGNLDDVLSRFAALARTIGSPQILRITADCPAIDPAVIDEVIQESLSGGYDACGLDGEFPNGLDCTVFSRSALEIAAENAELWSEREHVGPYILDRPHQFRIRRMRLFEGLGHHRWTLDHPQDYDFLTLIFGHLFPEQPKFGWQQIVDLLEERPWISALNSSLERGEGLRLSVEREQNSP